MAKGRFDPAVGRGGITKDNRERKKRSKTQERRVAAGQDGHRQPLSGSDFRAKADVSRDGAGVFAVDSFLTECKRTDHRSISVTADWLKKISKEAFEAGKNPALAIELNVGDDPLTESDWVLVPASVFNQMLAQLSGKVEE